MSPTHSAAERLHQTSRTTRSRGAADQKYVGCHDMNLRSRRDEVNQIGGHSLRHRSFVAPARVARCSAGACSARNGAASEFRPLDCELKLLRDARRLAQNGRRRRRWQRRYAIQPLESAHAVKAPFLLSRVANSADVG
jgi:hypothetical protein